MEIEYIEIYKIKKMWNTSILIQFQCYNKKCIVV